MGRIRTRVVRGRVVDHGTGAPLAGASVRLDGREVTAGHDGEFRLCGVAPGRVVARVAAGGYGADSAAVTITTRDTVLLLRLRRTSPGGETRFDFSAPSGTNPYNGPLVILDGERVLIDVTRCWAPRAGERRIDALRPEEMESLYVIKGGEAMTRYGPDARNGALLITSKAAARGARPE
jgi:hypothetical protein